MEWPARSRSHGLRMARRRSFGLRVNKTLKALTRRLSSCWKAANETIEPETKRNQSWNERELLNSRGFLNRIWLSVFYLSYYMLQYQEYWLSLIKIEACHISSNRYLSLGLWKCKLSRLWILLRLRYWLGSTQAELLDRHLASFLALVAGLPLSYLFKPRFLKLIVKIHKSWTTSLLSVFSHASP